MSYKATEQYKKLQNMPISKMFYRGDGWPGKNCLISSDGNKIEYVHNGSLFERMFSSQIFKNPGCRGCKDHFAEQAEISFCDFWNAEERKTESEGNSCVIIRSARADEYFNKMQKLGFIEVVRDLDEKEVADTQMHALKAKICQGSVGKNDSAGIRFFFIYAVHNAGNDIITMKTLGI